MNVTWTEQLAHNTGVVFGLAKCQSCFDSAVHSWFVMFFWCDPNIVVQYVWDSAMLLRGLGCLPRRYVVCLIYGCWIAIID